MNANNDFRLGNDRLVGFLEGDNDCTGLVLRILLNRPELRVTNARRWTVSKALPAMLDVTAVDEGQTLKVLLGAGDMDVRVLCCCAGLADQAFAAEGGSIDDLPETYVVCILEQDAPGGGEPIYTIERVNVRTGEPFGDGQHFLYVNGAYRDDSPVGKLLHDLSCTSPADMHYGILAERLKKLM